MFELITASIKQDNIEWLLQFPDELLSEKERMWLGFIFNYKAKYDVTVSLQRFVEEFKGFTPIDSNIPLGDIFEQTVKEKKLILVNRIANELILKATEDGEIDVETVNQLAQTLNRVDGGIQGYKGFNREEYLKPKTRMNFGIPLLDSNTGGLISGDFFIIAGKLGSYKTTLLQWIVYQWVKEHNRILFVSNELLPKQIFSKFDGMVGEFNPLLFRALDGIDEGKVRTIQKNLDRLKGDILIPSKRLMSPDEVFSTAQYLGATAVVIDGIHLMRISNRNGGELWQDLTRVSNELKQKALETNLPLLGVSQLNRSAGKGGGRYTTEDIGGSYALAQDADVMLAIQKDDTLPNHFSLYTIKNRFGKGDVEVMFKIEFDEMKLVDLSVTLTS